MKYKVICLLFFIVSLNSYATEFTEYKKVGRIQTNSSTTYVKNLSDISWFSNENGNISNTSNCNTAKEVYLSRSISGEGYSDLLAQVVFAKGTGQNVKFYGDCNSSGSVLRATGLFLE